jgi:hypothetical protein
LVEKCNVLNARTAHLHLENHLTSTKPLYRATGEVHCVSSLARRNRIHPCSSSGLHVVDRVGTGLADSPIRSRSQRPMPYQAAAQPEDFISATFLRLNRLHAFYTSSLFASSCLVATWFLKCVLKPHRVDAPRVWFVESWPRFYGAALRCRRQERTESRGGYRACIPRARTAAWAT